VGVSPCVLADRVEEEIHFLRAVFGSEFSVGDGPGEARIGGTLIIIRPHDEKVADAVGMLYVWAKDVEATHARALREGATDISAPGHGASGRREAGFMDPQGNVWWITQRITKLSNSEVERRLAEQRRRRM
jgi:uncharacterized glyoxalase superfamily protein PhnB